MGGVGGEVISGSSAEDGIVALRPIAAE